MNTKRKIEEIIDKSKTTNPIYTHYKYPDGSEEVKTIKPNGDEIVKTIFPDGSEERTLTETVGKIIKKIQIFQWIITIDQIQTLFQQLTNNEYIEADLPENSLILYKFFRPERHNLKSIINIKRETDETIKIKDMIIMIEDPLYKEYRENIEPDEKIYWQGTPQHLLVLFHSLEKNGLIDIYDKRKDFYNLICQYFVDKNGKKYTRGYLETTLSRYRKALKIAKKASLDHREYILKYQKASVEEKKILGRDYITNISPHHESILTIQDDIDKIITLVKEESEE